MTSHGQKVTKFAGNYGNAMAVTRIHSGVNSTQIASALDSNTVDKQSKPLKMNNPNMDQIIYDAMDDGSATAVSQSLIYPGQSICQQSSATNQNNPIMQNYSSVITPQRGTDSPS